MVRCVIYAVLVGCTLAARVEVGQVSIDSGAANGEWHLICNGYIEGSYRGRKGHGLSEQNFIGKDACLKDCESIAGCNFVTYDENGGKCWRETVPLVIPEDDCTEIKSAWSYWKGDAALSSDMEEAFPPGWHLFCHGYVDDEDETWRHGFGETPQRHLGKVGCMDACGKQTGCNFVTYDALEGHCWMEHMKYMPHHCDDNNAGWSFAKNEDDEIWSLEAAAHGTDDGWHFLCTGYLQANAKRKYELRKGLGQAPELNLGHDDCKKVCAALESCDLVTYDAGSGVCWLEHIGQTPRHLDCDDNPSGWSYWKGKLADL